MEPEFSFETAATEVENKQAVMRQSRDWGLRNMEPLWFHLQVIIHAVVARASIGSRDALRYWEVALFPPDQGINQWYVPLGDGEGGVGRTFITAGAWSRRYHEARWSRLAPYFMVRYCSRRTVPASPINVFGKEENGGNGGRVRNRMVVVAVVA